jgi:SP family general alpha glucoside:H+ symporter-like MFS transporter
MDEKHTNGLSKEVTPNRLELEDVALDLKMRGTNLNIAAKEGAQLEHQLTPWQAVKAYPMAIFWALMVSMCVVMEGYDTILIGNFFAYPSFAKKYGTYFPNVTSNDGYQLTAAWQAGLGNASGVGAFFGVLLNGYLVGLFGQKRVLLGSLVVLSAFIFMTFFAPNIQVLTAGEFLCGLPWGIFATIAPAYASEVLPLPLRVYLTSYTNMVRAEFFFSFFFLFFLQRSSLTSSQCFIMGQLIAAGVLDGCLAITNQWAYRIPFGTLSTHLSFILVI